MKKINELFEMIGFDGCKHIILSSVIVVVVNLFLPTWAAALIALAIGIGKEYYDYRKKGFVEKKDLMCDAIGVLIGIL